MNPSPNSRGLLLASLALLPLLAALAFVRVAAPASDRAGVPAPPVRLLDPPAADSTAPRIVRSPALFSLPSPLGFSSVVLAGVAPDLQLAPRAPEVEPLPALLPQPRGTGPIAFAQVFAPAAEASLRMASTELLQGVSPLPALPPVPGDVPQGVVLRFKQGLAAELFPGAALSFPADANGLTSRAWEMTAFLRVEPPGVVTQVMCLPAQDQDASLGESVSRAIRAWKPLPVSAPVEGEVWIQHTPPRTPGNRPAPVPP
jgi:hypothetical protein